MQGNEPERYSGRPSRFRLEQAEVGQELDKSLPHSSITSAHQKTTMKGGDDHDEGRIKAREQVVSAAENERKILKLHDLKTELFMRRKLVMKKISSRKRRRRGANPADLAAKAALDNEISDLDSKITKLQGKSISTDRQSQKSDA